MLSFSDSIPLLLFFVVFFMAFSFLQTVIVYIINHFIRKHWEVIVDKLLSKVVHHKTLTRALFIGSLALVFGVLAWFTPIIDVLVGGKSSVKILGAILGLEMFVVYFIADRTIKIKIEKRIHLYVYAVLSFLSFTGIMVMAEAGYDVYETSIKSALVAPIVENIEEKYEAQVEERLFTVMRENAKAGKCPYFDYADSEVTGGITQFFFLKDDLALKEEGASDEVDTRQPLAGKRCIHETTFILTPQGKWYQVLEQGI